MDKSASVLSAASGTDSASSRTDDVEVRVYARRYAQLALFSLLTFTCGFMWIAYAAQAEVFVTYFHVPSALYINLLAISFMVVYPVLLYPSFWVFNIEAASCRGANQNGVIPCRGGLRYAVLIGALLMAAGGVLRYVAVTDAMMAAHSDDTSLIPFALTMTGQVLAAIGQVFILGVPPYLASKWFGAEERNTASAVAISANNAGIAASFLASLLIEAKRPQETIPPLFLAQAIVSVAACMLILFFFHDSPPTPPSRSSQLEKSLTPERSATPSTQNTLSSNCGAEEQQPLIASDNVWSTWQRLAHLARDRVFIFFCLSYGLITAVSFGVSTVMAQVLAPAFPPYASAVGMVGFVVVVCGTVGALVSGWWLDRTHKYRLAYMLACGTSLLAVVGLHFVLLYAPLDYALTYYVTCALIVICGISGLAAIPIAYQYASELFYPHSDAMIANIFNTSANILGTVLVLGMSALDTSDGGVVDVDSPGQYTMSEAVWLAIATLAGAVGCALGISGPLKRASQDTAVQLTS